MDSVAGKFGWHDFGKPGWYLITLKAAARKRNVFAELAPDGFRRTPLGLEAERQWKAKSQTWKGRLVAQSFQTMPDHIHLVLHVAKPLNRPLGSLIGAYKAAVVSAARTKLGLVAGKPLWEPGFDWRIKSSPEEVAASRLYVEGNPAAAREKRAAKARFGAPSPIKHQRLPETWPDGFEEGFLPWTAFGNAALLDETRLVAVRVSTREPEERLLRIEARAECLAKEGAVLVSPAISPGEKRTLAAALRAGGRAIHVESCPIDAFYKPGRGRLAAFAEGRWLALSPFAPADNRKLDKPLCEALNACARAIAGGLETCRE